MVRRAVVGGVLVWRVLMRGVVVRRVVVIGVLVRGVVVRKRLMRVVVVRRVVVRGVVVGTDEIVEITSSRIMMLGPVLTENKGFRTQKATIYRLKITNIIIRVYNKCCS